MECLSTLGLRPGEVAGLCLDDIDWRGGTLQIRARKNRRGAVLPLPRVVGQALVAYLSGERPATDERRVFVEHLGDRRGEPLSSPAVSRVVARALRRAAVDTPLTCADLFRHTVANRMVRERASLKEVADVLGHRSLVVRHVIIFGYGHGLQRAIIDESQHRTPERLIMAQH